ncbi:Folylpolyglutamate synthetase [Cynara cardunculus var. scolymus]|uniref:Folylpolyglutamate synthase n=1 Tax=Cynara cardunculus var. scolymus TaxID=59895 RepID=A0A124SCT2_CYNCS|nr:Folylpolyglutamate synthetase [Cynara cardunculus var. scolymus]
MLLHSNTYMRRGMLGVAYFGRKELPWVDKVTREIGRSSHCLNTFNLTVLKTYHSLVKIRQKGLQYANMSSETVVTLNSRSVTSESIQECPLPFTYEAAMEALSSLITRKKRDGYSNPNVKYKKLERMSMYIQILGLEEQIADLNIIHVAGTKGKGSTCTFCEAILRECGFRTGLFTSPHLIDDKVTEDLPMPPLFQFLTLLGLKIFVSEKVDVAIIEVGLGGKYDSTNVIQDPVVCGITSLGFDHTEILGDTLEKIALHKAGIFKPQVPAFTVPQLPEAMDVLKQRAHELEVPLQVIAPLTYQRLNGVKLSLSGDHQLVNAGLAVSLCKSWLNTKGNWEKLGLSTAHLSGRAQIVHDSYLGSSNQIGDNESCSGELIFYLDGAHSPESIDACAKWFSNVVNEKIHRPWSSFSGVGNMEEVCSNGCIQHSNGQDESETIPKRILLFNCMEMRDPEIILPRLVDICASSGSHFSKAIFVPSISTYSKVTSGSSDIPLNIPSKDLAWQFNLQRVWERSIHGRDFGVNKNVKMEAAENLPSPEFLYNDDISRCNGNFSCSAVFPSLPLAVLVTGSLHLVGDVLKLLRRSNNGNSIVEGVEIISLISLLIDMRFIDMRCVEVFFNAKLVQLSVKLINDFNVSNRLLVDLI